MGLDHYHVIDLPDGTSTPGRNDQRDQPGYLGLSDIDLSGMRALDVAALDGFWAFWAEGRGAEQVLAVDVEGYAGYDWGVLGPPAGIEDLPHPDKAAVFLHLRERMGSQVERESCSVYELDPERHGTFDLIFMYGLLYHLRHPLRGIDALRRVCRGVAVIESHVVASTPELPMMLFYEDDVLARAVTNWCGPTEACAAHWLKSAGFSAVFVERREHQKRPDRQRFIGTVDPTWERRFSANPHFRRCDTDYYLRSRQAIEAVLAGREGSLRAQARGLLKRALHELIGRVPIPRHGSS